MRLTTTALAALALLTSASLASGANFQVTYRVDAKALKSGTPAGTPLTFQLYSDGGCTTAAGGSQVVNVENVALIEQPKLIKMRGAAKPPSVAEIRYAMTGVTPQQQLYATVSGAGISPVGGACQLQSVSVGGTTKSAVWVDANGKVVGPYYIGGFVILPLSNGIGALPIDLNNGEYLISAQFYFTSSDCSGTRLAREWPVGRQDLADLYWDGVQALAPSTPSTSLQANSVIQIYKTRTSQADCGSGTFVPPHGCCFQATVNESLAPVSPVDVSAYTTPFRLTVAE